MLLPDIAVLILSYLRSEVRAMGALLSVLLLTLTVEKSVAEFLELRSLSRPAQRLRPHLPAECEPLMSAVGMPSRVSRLVVLIRCELATASPRTVELPATAEDWQEAEDGG